MYRCVVATFAIIVALPAVPAAAAIYRVGSGAGCTHATIQSAIDAAVATASADEIRISGTQYTLQNLLIQDDSGGLTMTGGFASCTAAAPVTGQRTIIGGINGSPWQPVLRVANPYRVVLQNLDIRDGHAWLTASGAGISMSSNRAGELRLVDTLVRGNTQMNGQGGGIAIRDTQSPYGDAVLVLAGNSGVSSNTATTSGGGIHCVGSAVVLEGSSFVSQNLADSGDGGGIHAAGDCSVDIQSRGFNGSGAVIFSNQAPQGRGGGLFQTGARGTTRMWTVDPAVPARIVGNSAMRGGGAAVSGGAQMQLFNVTIETSIASESGGAVLVDDIGFVGVASRFAMLGIEDGAPGGAINCTTPEACNVARGNRVESAVPQPGNGALIAVDSDAALATEVKFRGTRIEGNVGTSLIGYPDSRGEIILNGALVTGNTTQGPLFLVAAATNTLQIAASTIVANTISSGMPVIAAAGSCDPANEHVGTRAMRSIVWQPGRNVTSSSASDCFRLLVGNQFDALPASPERVVADPSFVNAAGGDFRLSSTSPALDFSPVQVGDATRVAGLRWVDLPYITNLFGIQDLGAYERFDDRIFVSGFECLDC